MAFGRRGIVEDREYILDAHDLFVISNDFMKLIES